MLFPECEYLVKSYFYAWPWPRKAETDCEYVVVGYGTAGYLIEAHR